MEKLFSISEVAREISRSVDWLREAEKRGKLPRARAILMAGEFILPRM